MVDKISTGVTPPQPKRTEGTANRIQQPSSGENSVNAASNAGARDNAQLTTQSTFEQLQTRVSESSDFDAQRVADIKSAIERGEYTIDSNRISRAIVDLEHLLQNSSS